MAGHEPAVLSSAALPDSKDADSQTLLVLQTSFLPKQKPEKTHRQTDHLLFIDDLLFLQLFNLKTL